MSSFFIVAFQGSGAQSPLFQFVPVIIIFGIFYLLLIAPMRKRQKALQNLVNNLKKGDKVVTTGGLHGEVTAVKDRDVVLQIAENTRVRVSKSAIAGLEGQETGG